MTIVTPEPIDRDRFGRPLVIPPQGGKKIPYTRCTTFVDCLEDKYNLQKWQQRMVATGLSQRPDLLLAVSASNGDKSKLNAICEDALDAAQAHAAATTGTALHALTELIDRGQDLPVLPEATLADLEAYRTATADLKAVHIEQFCVMDTLKIGGTPDRVVTYQGTRYIADLKTGSIEFGALKIAMQLAVYARSHTYDIKSGDRGHHGADLTRGIIIHLPAGSATCTLYWVDLLAGWDAVLVARDVRNQRQTGKFPILTRPFTDDATFKPEPKTDITVNKAIARAASGAAEGKTLVQQVNAATTREELTVLWQLHEDEWTDELTRLAQKRVTALQLPDAS